MGRFVFVQVECKNQQDAEEVARSFDDHIDYEFEQLPIVQKEVSVLEHKVDHY